MMKLFHLYTKISAVLMPLNCGIALSQPIPMGFSSPVVESSDTQKPVCYMQTADDRVLDLTSFCKKLPASSTQQQGNSTNQSCSTKEECLRIFGSDNPPPPLFIPPDNSPAG